MLDVVIDRTKWGHGIQGGYLLQRNDKMCCLGFICKKIGLSDESIFNTGLISTLYEDKTEQVPDSICKLFKYSENENRQLQNVLVDVNDSHTMAEDLKESEIIRIGKEADINFSFIN